MTVHHPHPSENAWAVKAQHIAGGLASIKTAIDIGRTLYSAGTTIAPYVAAALAA